MANPKKYIDEMEEISQKAFTRRVNILKKLEKWYRIEEIDYPLETWIVLHRD